MTSGAYVRRGLALGYTTISRSDENGGRRLREEARRIEEACDDRGLTLSKVVQDREQRSGPDLERPGLEYALDKLALGEFGCLVVTRLGRLTRSAANLGLLFQLLERSHARLVVADIGLDTDTRDGRLAARVLTRVGSVERETLEQRTRKGLEAARDRRRPAVADRSGLNRRIADMRASGITLRAIADTLNAEGVPTVRGGAKWRPSSVQAATGYRRPARPRGVSPAGSRDDAGS